MPTPMRQLVLDRVEALGLSRYQVVQMVKGRVSAQAVYAYLAGKRDMTSDFVTHLLDVLGLEVKPKE
jgi:hypothetical protein